MLLRVVAAGLFRQVTHNALTTILPMTGEITLTVLPYRSQAQAVTRRISPRVKSMHFDLAFAETLVVTIPANTIHG